MSKWEPCKSCKIPYKETIKILWPVYPIHTNSLFSVIFEDFSFKYLSFQTNGKQPYSFPVLPCFCNGHHMQIVMTSDQIQIRIFANWPMSHAKRLTRDDRKNPEYRVAYSGRGFVNISRPAEYFRTCYTVLKRPNKVETAVHGRNLAFSLDSIVSLPR